MRVEDLKVYEKLFKLALEIHYLTLQFPSHELYELGSQLRRSSNSSPANLAEGFNNKHTNIYMESVSRAEGEIRETVHHLRMAFSKKYFSKEKLDYFVFAYEECMKMLSGLEKSLMQNHKK